MFDKLVLGVTVSGSGGSSGGGGGCSGVYNQTDNMQELIHPAGLAYQSSATITS